MNLYPSFATLLPTLQELDVYSDLPTWRTALSATAGPLGPADGVLVDEITIPRGDESVTARRYRPESPTHASGAGAVWIHGGGFAIGAPNAEDAHCRRLARELGLVVVSPDYRLAPEEPYPAAFEDCLATFTWFWENATTLGVDPERIALGGHSAGAALAAATALALGDTGNARPAYLYLGYPVLDDRQETASARTIVDGRLWNRPQALTMWKNYLGSTAPDAGYAVPSRAEDLSALPTTFLLTCELDPSHDEGLDFGKRLRDSGVLVECYDLPGVPHMFDVLLPDAPLTRRAVQVWTSSLADGLSITPNAG
ncbi:alpha/beta hydrolase [Cellulosimicrobium cellulans]|uniref:alpha/beta hydrolase n=1 Tax=Cellulosimicrobium cellulans TaxID=1710 RepID=UPI0037F50213